MQEIGIETCQEKEISKKENIKETDMALILKAKAIPKRLLQIKKDQKMKYYFFCTV